MTTHVFIVDLITFKCHLEYLFAGTGAKDNVIDFNNAPRSALYPTTENMLVGMIADASRIRRGDFVIFYLQQNLQQNIFDGKFYGIFRAKNDWSFLDNNDDCQYLKNELEKSLTFRTLIEPYRVYAEGVTEWEALDEIKHIQSPHQMLWSLIYRKLKGNRGNTMITIYEAERLIQLIRNKNRRIEISCDKKMLSFDLNTQRIVCKDGSERSYKGRREEINILPRLIRKHTERKSFEAHLRAYIVKNIGRGKNNSLDNTILNNRTIEWIGDEVSCGVGMRRIDILLSVVNNNQRVVIPIELKAGEANERNVIQIQRYVDWIEQYYIPNRQSDIEPVLASKKIMKKRIEKHRKIIASFNQFNTTNEVRCERLKYIEFDIQNNNLVFEEVSY